VKQILFVDDELQILGALRDALRRHRHEWDMVFCDSGTEALRVMMSRAFDVVLTDMRMPGMDRPTFLRHVRELYPATVCIVRSGQADRAHVLRTLTASHQFLAKPCTTDELGAEIDRACSLRALRNDPAILALIGDVEALPSTPASYWQLNELLSDREVGIAEISALVECDSALPVKLLQVANSAYFGIAKTVYSVSSAVKFLGVDLLKAMALMTGIFQSAPGSTTVEGFSISESQQQALLVAQVARRIVADRSRRDEAFTTGVLHDVGKLILATRFPTEYATVLREGMLSRSPLHEIEREIVGASHATIGAVLLGAWGLPYAIVRSVAYHHALTEPTVIDDPVTVAVHVADALLSTAMSGRSDFTRELDIDALQRHGLYGDFERWQTVVAEVLHDAVALS